MLTNQAFYDTDASTYDTRWRTRGGQQTDQTQRQIVRDLCEGWRGKRVLEIGSGTGRFSLELVKLGADLTLADLSGAMLDSVRQKLRGNGFDPATVRYVQSNIYALAFPGEAFDCMLSLNVLGHVEDIGRALRECARVLKPGGQFLFNYPNLNSYFWPAARYINRNQSAIGQPVFSRWHIPAALEKDVQAAGLEIVARVGHVHAPRGLRVESLGVMQNALAWTDAVSREGPLRRLAPVQFCLCVKV